MRIYLAGERSSIATAAAVRGHDSEDAEMLWAQRVRRRLFSYYYHGYAGAASLRDPGDRAQRRNNRRKTP